MPVMLQQHLSTREVERRWSRANRKTEAAPSRTAAQRVVIRLDPDVATPEEELYLLGALELLKRQFDQVQFVYAYANKEIGPAIRNRWFLKDSALCGGDNRFFDFLVGTDFGLTITEPDPLAAHQAEEAIYERQYQRRLAEVEELRRTDALGGLKDMVRPEPEHYFHPRWHKTNGYFWQVADALGFVPDVPQEPIAPFGAFSQTCCPGVYRSLQKARLFTRPSVVFDFSAENEILPMMAALGQSLPGYELVALQELARAIPADLVSLTSACFHENCNYVVGPGGPLTTAAWAAGVPNILLLYRGANSQWDGVHPLNPFTVSRDRLTDPQMADTIAHAMGFLTSRAARKGGR